MTDTKLRILIYGKGHQYAGKLAPDDVLDGPEENKNLLIFEGTPDELLEIAENLPSDPKQEDWPFWDQVYRTILQEVWPFKDPFLKEGEIRIVVYAQHCACAGELVPEEQYLERPFCNDYRAIEGTPEELLEIADGYAKGNQVFHWRVARSIKEAVRVVAPELVPDEDE